MNRKAGNAGFLFWLAGDGFPAIPTADQPD